LGTQYCVKDARDRAYDAACQALARRLASHNAGRSPLGAPPWRFWASGPRVSHRHPPFDRHRIDPARSSQPGRSAWRRIPEPPEASGLTRRRRTPLPAPPSGSPPETPLMSEDANLLHRMHYVVKR
jgi:hypothetical protein